MKYSVIATLLLLGIFLLSGCGSTEEARKDASAQPDEQERWVPLSQYERTFHPTDYDQEIEAVQTRHKVELERAATRSPADSVVLESEFSQGYRIQIFATASIDEANAMRLTAAQRVTEDSLYVVFDPPVYKVRIGDFRTKAEANLKLGSVSAMGFTDAWVVGDKIILRKLVRVPASPAPRH